MRRWCKSESESARYSIHLRESITWSACGNGQKKKEKKSKRERGDCNFPYIISRILNFGPVVCVFGKLWN